MKIEYRRYGRTVALHVGSKFSQSTIFHARQFDTVAPILRIPFVPAMLEALASELGMLTNRLFL
jgi:hypothetical protein